MSHFSKVRHVSGGNGDCKNTKCTIKHIRDLAKILKEGNSYNDGVVGVGHTFKNYFTNNNCK